MALCLGISFLAPSGATHPNVQLHVNKRTTDFYRLSHTIRILSRYYGFASPLKKLCTYLLPHARPPHDNEETDAEVEQDCE